MAARIKIGLGIAASILVILIGAFFLTHSKGQRPQGPKSAQGTLDGEVFIVTRGAQNIKLGLVQVRVLPYEATENSIAKTRPEVEQQSARLLSKVDAARKVLALAKSKRRAAYAKSKAATDYNTFEQGVDQFALAGKAMRADAKIIDLLEKQVRSWNLGALYFANLPPPLASVKTDEDGKFSIKLDRNTTIVLAAHATRLVFDKTEQYYWLVAVSLDGQLTKRIFLSNDNLITFESKDSPIHVAQ